MRVAMVGTRYVRLVSGACIANFSHRVTCVDKDGTKIAALNAGETPIYEPGLGELVRTNVAQGGCRSAPRCAKRWRWPTRCSSRWEPISRPMLIAPPPGRPAARSAAPSLDVAS